jgi:hypothetical protein
LYIIFIQTYSKCWAKWFKFTWWINNSWGGRSSGAFTCSLVLALNSASSSSSFSKERSHILWQRFIKLVKTQKKEKGRRHNEIKALKFVRNLTNNLWMVYYFQYRKYLRKLIICRWNSQWRSFVRTPLNGCDWILMVFKMRYHSISVLSTQKMHFYIVFKGKIAADEIRQLKSFFQNLVHVMTVLHQVHLEGL